MDQTAAKAELVTLLSDTLNQVSADRLTAAITQAWRDPWVCNQVWDTTSLVYTSSAYQYAVPAGITTIEAIYIQRAAGIDPEEISGDIWEVINNQIVFNKKAGFRIPSGFTLQIRGRYKLTSGNSIPVTNQPMQNYVVTLAAWLILRGIGMTKILSFLHNDTSISEVVAFRREIEQDMLKYRAQLQLSYVNG